MRNLFLFFFLKNVFGDHIITSASDVSIPLSVYKELLICSAASNLSALVSSFVITHEQFTNMNPSITSHQDSVKLMNGSIAAAEPLLPADTLRPDDFLKHVNEGHRNVNGTFLLEGDLRLPWQSSDDICNLLEPYGQLVMLGDSIIRQLGITTAQLLRDSLLFGGLRDWELVSHNISLENECKCFSGWNAVCGYEQYKHEARIITFRENVTLPLVETKKGSAHLWIDSASFKSTREVGYNKTRLRVCPHLKTNLGFSHLWAPFPQDMDNPILSKMLSEYPKSLVLFGSGLWYDHQLHDAQGKIDRMASLKRKFPNSTLIFHGLNTISQVGTPPNLTHLCGRRPVRSMFFSSTPIL